MIEKFVETKQFKKARKLQRIYDEISNTKLCKLTHNFMPLECPSFIDLIVCGAPQIAKRKQPIHPHSSINIEVFPLVMFSVYKRPEKIKPYLWLTGADS